LGKRVKEFLERDGYVEVYFAEYQSTFEAFTKNILGALNRCIGFIGIMHHRGEVHTPKGPTCLSSIILSPLNGNVKLSPHETGDIHVESEGTAASDRHFAMRAREPDVCQSRGAARPITAACQTA